MATSNFIRTKLTELRKKQACCVQFWNNKYPDLHINKVIFSSAFKATKEVRLRTLQWKIVHNIYPTQILLHIKWGKQKTSTVNTAHRGII